MGDSLENCIFETTTFQWKSSYSIKITTVMKYKNLIFLLFLFLNTGLFAQEINLAANEAVPKLWEEKLYVDTGFVSFNGVLNYAYTISVFELDKTGFLANLWKKEIKEKGGKIKTSKGVASADKVSFPEIHAEYLDVLAMFEVDKDNDIVKMSVAFMKNKEAIGPESDQEAHLKAMKVMYDLAVRMNRAVVNEQVVGQEKELAKLEKDLENLKKENKKLHESIEKNKKNLTKAGKDQNNVENDLKKSRKELTDYEKELGASANDKQLKELSKMRNNLERMEKKIGNLINDQKKYENTIRDAKKAIPKNETEQEGKILEIENQKFMVRQYRQKLADIN